MICFSGKHDKCGGKGFVRKLGYQVGWVCLVPCGGSDETVDHQGMRLGVESICGAPWCGSWVGGEE